MSNNYYREVKSVSIREIIENNEKLYFCDRACLSSQTAGRKTPEAKCEIRTEFQRDRDRIIHSSSFRRLKHKTQVFIAPGGDHYRTRLTHTLEVNQIARSIAKALLLNEDLTEAIALGHDLGHTPFGHAGERGLNKVLSGGFKHYEQSVRVCEKLEKGGKGLNLTAEVLDGILCHTNSDAKTLEGRIVRFADRIAYMNHDIDDAVKAGIMCEKDIPVEIREAFGEKKSKRIDTMVKSIISNGTDDINLSAEHRAPYEALHKFMFESVYTNKDAKKEEPKVELMIESLFEHLCKNPDKLPNDYKKIVETEGVERATADYIGSMTDRYALHIYNELFVPKSWMVF